MDFPRISVVRTQAVLLQHPTTRGIQAYFNWVPNMQKTMTLPDSTISGLDESGNATRESRLVDEARRGNQAAFGELVSRYERRMIRVILQFVKNQELAEDLAQDAFLKAYQRLAQFDTSRRFGPWLFRIGVNQTLDYLRRRKRRGWWLLFSERGTEREPDPAITDPRQQLDLEQEVAAVLEQIPENYRIVLMLRELQNFSTSEIAAILERKEATIRWRLAEARTMFHDIWVKRRDGASHDDAPISMSVASESDKSKRKKGD